MRIAFDHIRFKIKNLHFQKIKQYIFVFFSILSWNFAYVKYFLAWQLSLILCLLCHLLNVRLKILVFPRNFHLRTKVFFYGISIQLFMCFSYFRQMRIYFGVSVLNVCVNVPKKSKYIQSAIKFAWQNASLISTWKTFFSTWCQRSSRPRVMSRCELN